jgi:hypothetical protein
MQNRVGVASFLSFILFFHSPKRMNATATILGTSSSFPEDSKLKRDFSL